jgi:hypothetical protein
MLVVIKSTTLVFVYFSCILRVLTVPLSCNFRAHVSHGALITSDSAVQDHAAHNMDDDLQVTMEEFDHRFSGAAELETEANRAERTALSDVLKATVEMYSPGEADRMAQSEADYEDTHVDPPSDHEAIFFALLLAFSDA